MSNIQGIAIVIRAFLPTGKTLDEQFAALSIVKAAHETGDYAPLLAAAKIDDVKTEQKTRRMEVEPQAAAPQPEPADTGALDVSGMFGSAEEAEQAAATFDAGIDEPRENPEDDALDAEIPVEAPARRRTAR